MKVNVAHAVSRQMADTSDLASMLTGDGRVSFASMLGPDGTEPGAVHKADENQGKQGNRPKEKESNEDQRPRSGEPRPTTTTGLLGLQALPNVGVTPWAIRLDEFGANGDAEEAHLSLSGTGAMGDAFATNPRVSTSTGPIANAAAPNDEKVLGQNIPGMAPANGTGDPQVLETRKGAPVTDQDRGVVHAAPSQNDKETVSTTTRSSPASSGIVEQSAGSVDSRLRVITQQDGTGANLVTALQAQSSAVTVHEVTLDGAPQNPGISAEERLTTDTGQKAGGQQGPPAPLQGAVDTTSGLPVVSLTRGNGGNEHRGSADARESAANNRDLAPQVPQAITLGDLSPGISGRGHSAPTNSTHLETARDPTPDAQLKELLPSRGADPSATRLLGSAIRSDTRVGVQTEAFGRVTIQTSAQGGQLSAQLSLENGKESATLAAHLPSVEQKIIEQHGLNASVRIAGSFDAGAGAGSMGRDQSGSGRRDSELYRNDAVIRSGGIEHGSPSEGRGIEPALLGNRYLATSRLDVTV